MTGDGSGDLPQKELTAKVIEIAQGDMDHRAPGCLQPLELRISVETAWLIARVQVEVDEKTVIPVKLWINQLLPHDGQDAFAGFTGALGNQLLCPIGKAIQGGRIDKGELITAEGCKRTKRSA